MAEKENVISLIHDGTRWLPGSYSTMSDRVDLQFNTLLWFSIALTVAIILVTLGFSYVYRKRAGNAVAKKQVTHNNRLEIVWTVIPFVLVMIVFFWGFTDYLKLTVSPPGATEIHVTGMKWNWVFEYPNKGVKSMNALVVPVNEPIKLVMTSKDVLHSFFIPNFRVKRDLVPNKYSNVWFEAKKQGVYQVLCTEYCGDEHSNMSALLKVVSRDEYEAWLKNELAGDDIPLDQLGETLYTSKGCNACHSIDGTSKIGPTWKGLYGMPREFSNAETEPADENYLRESIVYPGKKLVVGYQNVMPSYAGLLSDREISALIEYIKSLK